MVCLAVLSKMVPMYCCSGHAVQQNRPAGARRPVRRMRREGGPNPGSLVLLDVEAALVISDDIAKAKMHDSDAIQVAGHDAPGRPPGAGSGGQLTI